MSRVPELDLKALYTARAERFETELRELEARSRLVSNLRGLSFGSAVITFGVALFGQGGAIAGVLGALLLVAFAALIGLHARVAEQESAKARFALVNRDALARVSHGWHALPDRGQEFNDATQSFADDLDVFGQGSLYQRICTARTRYGRRRLAALLSLSAEQATLGDVTARQDAVRALTPRLEQRQTLEALALAVVNSATSTTPKASNGKAGLREPDPEPLLRWAEAAPELLSTRGLGVVSWVLPTLTGGAILGSVLSAWPNWSWLVLLLLQVVVALSVNARASNIFGAVSSTEGAFLRYGGMLELLEQLDPAGAVRLEQLKAQISTQGTPASRAMQDFRQRVAWFDLRHNGMVHPFAAVLLLWDVHCGLALERWKGRYGRNLRAWFESIGELEALAALAGLAHDEPSFTFPTLVVTPATFEVSALGHPLLAAEQRVVNDVLLSGPGSALLVTGSNMSGKSTLLRAMGLAAVLASAGAPICAKQAQLSLFRLRTSIRVRDSLEGGVSHFYAELSKLKAVVTAAEQAAAERASGGASELAPARPVLFLLDEILHGTNSTERQIGARWVLSRLLQLGALGAISTHDLELCRLSDDMMRQVALVHFREQVSGDRMSFDYKLRSGPVTAGNALRLMRQVGIDVPLT